MSQTALLVPVPRVGPLIAPWSLRYDPSMARGIPPHVTILFPFLPTEETTRDDLDALEHLIGTVPAFSSTLTKVGMFERNEVLHLVPAPDDPFRTLTREIRTRWPRLAPYEGRHEDPAPHVTVGFHIPRPSARHAARSLMLSLPIRFPVEVVQLWAGDRDGWDSLRTFPLRR